MPEYNEYPIYGIGFRGPGKEWSCKGLIFDPEDKVTEIKSFEHGKLTFASKKKAEDHALQLCKSWIDEQKRGTQSTGVKS